MAENKRKILEDLVNLHGPALLRFLTRKLRNQEEAAEVAQETYLRLYKLKELDQVSDTRAFLFQAASNMAVDQLRRKILHDKYVSNEEQKADSPQARSPEQIVDGQQQLQRIYQAIEKLPLKCRQAFLLHRKSGLSYSEIAKEMDISVSSVEKYILQALVQCRRTLATAEQPQNGTGTLRAKASHKKKACEEEL